MYMYMYMYMYVYSSIGYSALILVLFIGSQLFMYSQLRSI